ncbi:hypothetical protein D3C87_1420520 [compost metagenome]
MLKTLSTADHQCVQVFRFNQVRQRCRRVLRQLATIQFQILDTSTSLAQALGQQLAPALTAQDQHPRIRPGDSLAQRCKFKQGFTVIAALGEAHVQAMILKDLRRRRADTEPLHKRCLRANPLDQVDTDSRSGFADHDHRAVAIQRPDHIAHCVRGRDRHDVQKRQATAENPLPGQQIAQRRRLIRGTRQQQAPACHS